MATNFVKKMTNSALSLLWHSETEWDNALYMQDLMAPLMPLYRKILVKIGPVVLAENRLTDGNALWFGDFVKYVWIYWTDFRNLFTI